MTQQAVETRGAEYRTQKGEVKLFLWRKRAPGAAAAGTIFFVHGSSLPPPSRPST